MAGDVMYFLELYKELAIFPVVYANIYFSILVLPFWLFINMLMNVISSSES